MIEFHSKILYNLYTNDIKRGGFMLKCIISLILCLCFCLNISYSDDKLNSAVCALESNRISIEICDDKIDPIILYKNLRSFILNNVIKNKFYESRIAIIKVITDEDFPVFLLSFIEIPKSSVCYI